MKFRDELKTSPNYFFQFAAQGLRRCLGITPNFSFFALITIWVNRPSGRARTALLSVLHERISKEAARKRPVFSMTTWLLGCV